MWCCEMEPGNPVELMFHLPSVTPTDHFPHGVSKICVWNYNKGMKVLLLWIFANFIIQSVGFNEYQYGEVIWKNESESVKGYFF